MKTKSQRFLFIIWTLLLSFAGLYSQGFGVTNVLAAPQVSLLTVDDSADVGEFSSIASPDENTVYIAYKDEDADTLKVAKSVDGGSSFTTSVVDNVSTLSVGFSDIYALDANTVVISYSTFDGLKLAKTTDGGSNWTLSVVDGVGQGRRSGIRALDANTIYIAYQRSLNSAVLFAKSTDGGSNWSFSTIDSVDPSQAVDLDVVDANTLFVAYPSTTNGSLQLNYGKSTDAGDSWTTAAIDTSSFAGGKVDIEAIDANTVYIAYTKGFSATLALAKSTDAGGNWSISSIESGSGVGFSGLSAIDTDTLFAGYRFDGDDTVRLRYSSNAGSSWSLVTVDSVISWTTYVSTIAPTSKRVFMSWYDNTFQSLRFASIDFSFRVSSVSPAANAIATGVNDPIQVVFNQSLNTSTVDANSFRVWSHKSGVLSGSLSFSTTTSTNDTVTFTPDEPFLVGDRVFFTLTDTIRSSDNTAIEQPYSYEFRVESTAGLGTFTTSSTPTIGTSPTDIDIADVDSDGLLDLLTTNSTEGSLSLFLGIGAGQFSAEQELSTENTPAGSSFADIDNDGDVDIVVFNKSSATFSVFANNGDGTFAARVNYGTGASEQRNGIADYNGDGYLDIAAHRTNSTMDIFLNDGTGSFPTQTNYTSRNAVNTDPADLDNDGDMDVAVLMRATNGVAYQYNQGDGTFPDAIPPANTINVVFYDIEAGDLNNDGYQDLVLGSFSSGDNLFRRLINNGDQTFSLQTTNSSWDISQATLGDVDVDGDLDLIGVVSRAGSDFVRLGYNNGDGTVTTLSNFGTGQNPIAVETGDFNNDGAVDLAVANGDSNTISVLLNDTPNNAPTVTSPTAISQATDGSGAVSFDVDVADADNDLTQLTVEYSDDGGTSFYAADISDVTADNGSVNTGVGLIGDTDAIDTDTGSRTLTITWDTSSANNGNGAIIGEQNDIQIRVQPSDGFTLGTAQTTTSFTVDNLAPTGLTELLIPSQAQTEADLSWSAVTETNFDHYEIWYGDTQAEVISRSGSAQEWDDGDDVNLANISTTTSTITGLSPGTAYFFKIFAIDSFGNEETVVDKNIQTASSADRRRRSDDGGFGLITEPDADGESDQGAETETPSTDTEQKTNGDIHEAGPGITSPPSGKSKNEGYSAIRKLEALQKLFAWMNPSGYQLSEDVSHLRGSWQNIFSLRSTIETIAQWLDYGDGFTYVKPEKNYIENVAEFLKILAFNFHDCLGNDLLQRMRSHDIPGNEYWWAGYWHVLGDIIPQPYVLWDPVIEDDKLQIIKALLINVCQATNSSSQQQ